jgi:pteridine reductase
VDLEGKVAVVTGGSVRIGHALSVALARAGASVMIHSSRAGDESNRTVDEINSAGGKAAAVVADFGHPADAAREVFEAAVDRFGWVDVLVNNAAIFSPGTLASTTETDWDRHFDINLKAPFFLCREFASRRERSRPGAIVNIADWRGLRPTTGHLAYSLTKTALVSLTQILAKELGPEVRVNAVAPGAILPPAGADHDYMRQLRDEIPLRRTGSADDVASAVLYLLRSDFVTGDVLCVTGGQHLQ